MITTKNIELEKPNDFDNLWIEKELSKLGYDVIRWAIIDVTDTKIIILTSVRKSNC